MNNKNNEMDEMMKKVQRGQFQTVNANQNFFDFYDKLVEYFDANGIPRNDLYLIKDQPRFYTIDNDLRMSENVIMVFNAVIANIKFLPHKNGIELYRFEIFQVGKGVGSLFMKWIIEVAKQLNIKIYLNPSHPGTEEFGDEKRIKKFFRRFNFKPIPGSLFWVN